MARSSPSPVRQLDVLGLIAEYGSIRKAAEATGVPKSTLYDQSRGVTGALEKTVQAVGQAVGDVAKALGGLIGDLAGGKPAEYRETGKAVARQQRSQPEAIGQQLEDRRASMARVGLAPDGSSLPPPPDMPSPDLTDSRGRPITPEQQQAYQELLAAYEAGELDADRYARFQGYQLGSGSGGTGVPIAPL